MSLRSSASCAKACVDRILKSNSVYASVPGAEFGELVIVCCSWSAVTGVGGYGDAV